MTKKQTRFYILHCAGPQPYVTGICKTRKEAESHVSGNPYGSYQRIVEATSPEEALRK